VTLEGEAREIPKATPEYEGARSLYVERFPNAKMTFDLGDFGLFSMRRAVAACCRICAGLQYYDGGSQEGERALNCRGNGMSSGFIG